MEDILTFTFNKEGIEGISKNHYGKNWPVVYILENLNKSKEMYIGQSTKLSTRSKQHYNVPERQKMYTNLHLITDCEYNLSAAFDIESLLIQHISAENEIELQNGNSGLNNHNYYDKELYRSKFELIWEELRKKNLVSKSLLDIKNSDLFKFSPYKALTQDQNKFVEILLKEIKSKKNFTFVVNGSAGTGKTILAIYLIKRLIEENQKKDFKIALVIPMSSLRATLKKVFRNIKGLKANMVIGPNDICKNDYDLLIADEAHRLRRRKNLGQGFVHFDRINKNLGLKKDANHLDWIKKCSKKYILFYDSAQNIMPGDISKETFDSLNAKRYDLKTQLRVQAGNKYIKLVENLFNENNKSVENVQNYDFKIFENISDMIGEIKTLDKKYGLSRIVAGYSWPWLTNKDSNTKPNIEHDIEIENIKLKWNSCTKDWVNSENAVNEVGCIHSVQGYDLNYVGVIIGNEIKYNTVTKKIEINRASYCDRNGHAGVRDEEELKKYIINIYKTLLTRGIKGTFLYIMDKDLKNFLKSKIKLEKVPILSKFNSSIEQNGYGIVLMEELDTRLLRKKVFETKKPKIKILAQANAGEPTNIAEEDLLGYVIFSEEETDKYNKNLFCVKVDGHSMNKKKLNGKYIEDGDCVLIEKVTVVDNGDVVLSILNGAVNIKEFYKNNNVIFLKSISTEPFKDIKITKDIDYYIIGKVIDVFKKNRY